MVFAVGFVISAVIGLISLHRYEVGMAFAFNFGVFSLVMSLIFMFVYRSGKKKQYAFDLMVKRRISDGTLEEVIVDFDENREHQFKNCLIYGRKYLIMKGADNIFTYDQIAAGWIDIVRGDDDTSYYLRCLINGKEITISMLSSKKVKRQTEYDSFCKIVKDRNSDFYEGNPKEKLFAGRVSL
ncbi:MAG: hypothetical protein II685_05430 [Clostridia bacterium]|nr:hypothetical protein [Clostridia bacterium]